MDLKINLATRYFFDSRKFAVATAAAFAVVLLVSFVVIANFAANAGREKRLTADIAAQKARFDASAKGVSEKEYAELLKRIGAANGIIRKKSFDWLLLLDHLEMVVPDGVVLSAIEPNMKDGTLSISGTAKEFRHLRVLVENLESSPHMSDVFLQRQSETTVGLTQRGVTFTVTCKVALS